MNQEEVIKQSVVDNNNYGKIKEMLLSTDEASRNVGLTILEEADYSESEVYVLCIVKDCFREAFGSVSSFKELTPTLFEKITKSITVENNDITNLSFKSIFDKAMERGKETEIEFILNIFRDELVELLREFNYTFMDFMELTLKPIGWEAENKKKLARLKELEGNAEV
jgi:hypothetical protein